MAKEEIKRRSCFIAAAVLCLGLTSCGGDGLKRVAVQGKITNKDQPLDYASVAFVPTGSTPGMGGGGLSDSDGNFTLISSRSGDKGIPPGEYKVLVRRFVTPDGKPLPPGATEADNPDARESIPTRYTSVASTPLSVTVSESGGEVKIDVPETILGRK